MTDITTRKWFRDGISGLRPWLEFAAPNRVVIAGDWHTNTKWGMHVIEQAAIELHAEPGIKVILHAGDIGTKWPGFPDHFTRLSEKLSECGVLLLMVDGNHDNHDWLGLMHANEPGPIPLDHNERIWHLPRGFRWEWNGIRWLAVGGAGSPDWKRRVPGASWWPQEVISTAEAREIAAGGDADVLLAHDCPAYFYPALAAPPSWWDLTVCHSSSQRLQDITDAAKPHRVFHGHLHVGRDDAFQASWGTVGVTGLDADGNDANWQVIDARTLERVSR